jgi:hypothetical protein
MKSIKLLIIFLVCLVARVHAHDPGLSGVEIRVESGQLSAYSREPGALTDWPNRRRS